MYQWLLNHEGNYNHQCHELMLWSEDEIEKFVTDEIVNLIDLVIVADRFDESLIVMRHLLNWDIR